MGLLRVGVAGLASIAGCYSPEVRDCTLTCSAASDCVDGQVCGSDHFCAAPAIAGQCASLPGGDAGDGIRDAGVIAPIADARPDAPDAATHTTLSLMIDGQGRITVQGIAT